MRAIPTVIGNPTSRATRARSSAAISSGGPDDLAQAADLEERLVDREALDERRGVAEDREHGLARRGVGVHPRRHDDRLGAERPAWRPFIAVRTPRRLAS